jgi:ABC-2 type transport system ATP-binding protein
VLLEVEGLTKTYRNGFRGRSMVRANDGISLSLEAGQVFGLLGHNGAGKTTLINQVVGLLKPDAGAIVLDGRDVVADPGHARRACSLQAQAQVPINGLTPVQAIGLIGELRGGSPAEVRKRGAALIEALDLGEWQRQDGARLSGGVKRLVSFCMAAVVPGRVVMLDEPTNDVDPVRRRLLWHQVRALADDGAAVLLVTHNVIEAERSVDRLAILDAGKAIVEGTPAELKASVASELRLELSVEPDGSAPPPPSCVLRTVTDGNRVIHALPATAADDVVRWASQLRQDGAIEEYALGPATLEDVYISIVDRADATRREEAAGVAAP